MHRDLVRANLRRCDGLLMQEPRDGFLRARDLARHVDADALEGQIAMRLGHERHPITIKNGADAGGVALAHLIDAEGQMNRHPLFVRKRREQRMLGAAGAAPLWEHEVEVGTVGIPSIWQLMNESRRRAIILDAEGAKLRAHLARRIEPLLRQRIPTTQFAKDVLSPSAINESA